MCSLSAKCLSSLDVEELVSLVERPAVQLQVQPVHAPRHPRAQARRTVRSPPVHLAYVLVQRIDLVGIGRGDVGDVDRDGRPVQFDHRARRGRIVRHEPVDTFDGGGGGWSGEWGDGGMDGLFTRSFRRGAHVCARGWRRVPVVVVAPADGPHRAVVHVTRSLGQIRKVDDLAVGHGLVHRDLSLRVRTRVSVTFVF